MSKPIIEMSKQALVSLLVKRNQQIEQLQAENYILKNDKKNCIDADKGTGFCNHCAEGNTHLCRWLNTPKTLERLEELQAEDAKSKHDIEMLHDSVNKLQAKLERINTKINRWQKIVDGSCDPRNPTVQRARDETMQECINILKTILEQE